MILYPDRFETKYYRWECVGVKLWSPTMHVEGDEIYPARELIIRDYPKAVIGKMWHYEPVNEITGKRIFKKDNKHTLFLYYCYAYIYNNVDDEHRELAERYIRTNPTLQVPIYTELDLKII